MTEPFDGRCAGLLLAAGSGSRFGGPKALALVENRPLVARAVDVLRGGGCRPVHVVVGAYADEVSAVVPSAAVTVHAADWERGMGESLRVGLTSLTDTSVSAVLIHLVDLPDVGADLVARFVAAACPDALIRATFADAIGHPVLVGRTWWPTLLANLSDSDPRTGARSFLNDHRALTLLECSDLATGRDVDYAADLAHFLDGTLRGQ
ncbi:nucleotidyltransferase family protein [Antrihabitans stalagmiti]|uniref:nucleotidyltransferase family protein n=1 Tax=Antrihabitans stalagmiti TaxID=2799499 RepID=UPI0027DC051C|nr:nucleotidyltransferase family protein [Antrihabitans stalagmiti]